METLPNSKIASTSVDGLSSAVGSVESLATAANPRNDFPAVPTDLNCRRTPIWKRILDLLIVAAISPILLPVMFLIACHIKLSSKGPVLFCQRRLGYGGKHFTILKFRTLKPEEYCVTSNHRAYVADLIDSDKPAAKPDISKRLIPGGKFLRDASLDELPQLFNVLLGDMSIVGPRPDVLEWEDYKAWQCRRFEVAPGITGLWQVSGKNRLTFDEMIRLDIQYVETRSIKLDFWILWKTLAVVLGRGNK
ncbi:MAG: sugar transferase [Planctomycetes bacterium]|nr:sugar transferase [Planctomycetota bacterium]